MTIESFDADGRKHPPRHDLTMYAVIAALVVVPALASVGIAWVLDANLSPWRVFLGLAALFAMTALFAVWEWVHMMERHDYEQELARRDRDIARLHRAVDDAISEDDAA